MKKKLKEIKKKKYSVEPTIHSFIQLFLILLLRRQPAGDSLC